MPVQMNLDWNKIREEINRLSDLNVLKSEIYKVRDEVKNFDYHTLLSPTAKKRVRDFENRYNKLMKTVGSAQRQLDREFNKLLRQVKKHRDTAEHRIDQLKNLADEQKNKIDRIAQDLKSKLHQNGGKKTAKKSSKKSAKKTASKKTSGKKKTTAKNKK